MVGLEVSSRCRYQKWLWEELREGVEMESWVASRTFWQNKSDNEVQKAWIILSFSKENLRGRWVHLTRWAVAAVVANTKTWVQDKFRAEKGLGKHQTLKEGKGGLGPDAKKEKVLISKWGCSQKEYLEKPDQKKTQDVMNQ